MRYYDAKNVLIRKSFFSFGKKDGITTEFYANGFPSMQTTYSMNRKNGIESYFDSAGNCFYSHYYYFDLPVGPIIYCNADSSPKRFFFINLQNETLLDLDFRNWKGIKDKVLDCINFTYEIQKTDSIREGALLLYLISPPKLRLEYSILRGRREPEGDFHKVLDIRNDGPFVNLTLPLIPDSLFYQVQLSIYDSILNNKSVIRKEIW